MTYKHRTVSILVNNVQIQFLPRNLISKRRQVVVHDKSPQTVIGWKDERYAESPRGANTSKATTCPICNQCPRSEPSREHICELRFPRPLFTRRIVAGLRLQKRCVVQHQLSKKALQISGCCKRSPLMAAAFAKRRTSICSHGGCDSDS